MNRHGPKPTGSLRVKPDGTPVAVVWVGKKRKCLAMPALKADLNAARARCTQLAAMAEQLRPLVDSDRVGQLLTLAAGAPTAKAYDAALSAMASIVNGAAKLVKRREPSDVPTFKGFATEWTNGKLAERFPDHIKGKKTSSDDEQRMKKHVYPLVGAIRLDEFSLDHAEVVMSNLALKEPASRRQIAQLMHRVLALAVYPARIIKVNPLPRGFLPKPRADKAKSYLYPDEDRKLLACVKVPLEWRILLGFLAREGMRSGEAMSLEWSDIDLHRGAINLDTNKTDDPRAWALDAGVARALKKWKKLHGETAHVFGEEMKSRARHNAEQLRAWLTLAGIERAQLTERSASRIPIRLHDLRATFATCAFANGKSEAWITDRTGHKSSSQLYGYKRTARTWSELKLGELTPLDEAIPELLALD